jgi:hypothetical protein
LIYQSKDEKKNEEYNFNNLFGGQKNDEPASRPVKRLYINFDKDIA